MGNKLCAYTCITGSYDSLKELDCVDNDIDYYCFTNNKDIKSNTWNVIYINDDNKDGDLLLARRIKILGHPLINDKYTHSFWVDGSLKVLKNIKDFIEIYCNDDTPDLYILKHHERDCAYKEAKVCVELRKDSVDNISRIVKFLENENYPKDNGLCESGIIFRKLNSDNVKKATTLWFEMVKNFSKRDQLSFNYSAYKTDLNFRYIDINVFDSSFFEFVTHLPKKIENNRPHSYVVLFNTEYEYFCDENFLSGLYEQNKDGSFLATFICQENIERIFFSPTSICYTQIADIKFLSCEQIKSKMFSIDLIGSNYFTYNNSPYIIIEVDFKKGMEVSISLRLCDVNFFEFYDIAKNIQVELTCCQNNFDAAKNELAQNAKSIEYLDKELCKTNEELHNLQSICDGIYNSLSWKITKPLRLMKKMLLQKK